MKKTLNINLAGYPFTIDEDAYNLLKDYLDTIRYAFDTNDDTGEIAADIESRIAELLIENEDGKVGIISLEEISKVIERIGKPSEFIEIDESFTFQSNENEDHFRINEEKITPPPYEPNKNPGTPFRKKLFRNPQNAMLGGVCAGLAAYLNADVTVVRLLTVILFFLSASTVAIAYIILWIVVPEARTPLQRMQMMGQDPTVENIGKTVTENFQNEDNTSSNTEEGNRTGINRFLTNAFSIFVKCIVILCFILAFPVLLALLLVLLACIIAFFTAGGALIGGSIFGEEVNLSPHGGVMALYLLLATIGALITLGIPFWLLIRMVFNKNKSNISTNNRRSLLIIWLAGIALTAVFTVKSVKMTKYLEYDGWDFNINKIESLDNVDVKDIEDISIKKGEVTVTTKQGTKYKVTKGNVSIESEESTETSEMINDSPEIISPVEPMISDTITSPARN